MADYVSTFGCLSKVPNGYNSTGITLPEVWMANAQPLDYVEG